MPFPLRRRSGQASSLRSTVIALLTTVASVSPGLVPVVRAKPAATDVTAAAEAFSTGQRAELAGEHARAAEFYELADSIMPAPEALRSSAKNRLAAGHRVEAATHAEALLERYPDDEASVELAQRILGDTERDLARVEVECPEVCALTRDGIALRSTPGSTHLFYVDEGEHEIVATFGDEAAPPMTVEARAGEAIRLRFSPVDDSAEVVPSGAGEDDSTDTDHDPSPSRDPGSDRVRISPAWFGTTLFLTAGAGAATLWSGLDVLEKNRGYEDDPTRERYEQGRDAELRTNVLIGVTAALGLTTIVLAAFTDWTRGRSSSSRARLFRPTASGMEVRF